jgi:hypothetical protein
MHELKDVQEYLKKLSISDERIEQCYNLISEPERRVDDPDEQWVACTEDHELDTAYKAVKKILLKYDSTIDATSIKNSRDRTCEQFKKVNLKMKHRIPFYVLMIDKLI